MIGICCFKWYNRVVSLVIVCMILVMIFEIPVEISFDLFSVVNVMIGGMMFMDISSIIGGLGVPGVRA